MSIRTTVTLDDDVLERLKLQSSKRGEPFRSTLNSIIRLGLIAAEQSRAPRQVPPPVRPMGVRRGLNYDSTSGLLENGEGEIYR